MENPEAESGSSSMSLKRDDCEDQLIHTKIDHVGSTAGLRSSKEKQEVEANCASVCSDQSRDWFINFKETDDVRSRENSRPDPSCVSLRSDCSRDWFINFKTPSAYIRDKDLDVSSNEPLRKLDTIFKCLEENIMTFVIDQLKKFHRVLALDYTESLESEEDEEQSSREAFLKITVDFLKRMDQEKLAELLQNKSLSEIRNKLKSRLQQRFSCVYEGIAKAGNPTLLNQIYTELYITEGGTAGVNQEHEVRHIESASRKPATTESTITCEDIFKGPTHRQEPIRTLLTEEPIMTELTERPEPIRTLLTEEPIMTELTERLGPITTLLTKAPIMTELTERPEPIRTLLTEEPIMTELTERLGPITTLLTEAPIMTELTERPGPIRTLLTEEPIMTERRGPIKSKLSNLVGKLRPLKIILKKAHRPFRSELTETQGPINTELAVAPIRTELTEGQGPMRKDLTEGQGPSRRKLTERNGLIRTVLTKGVAGIGKTVLTRKFSLDWAEGRANQDIHLLFPFTFRELNVLRDRQFSLVGLLQHFFSETAELCSFEDLQVVFILDGLDECRLPLDFTKTRVLTEATESVSVDVLLVNLIRGSLLSSARLWITTRPAAANLIPAECVSIVTEVRGFTDPQKEQYFKKRFKDQQQARAVISHIKVSPSLHIMCHIPIFCWIISTVLQHVIEIKARDQMPQTLTQMYIHFLVVQAKVKSHKYDGHSETDLHWTPETKKMVESLGKLGFEQLQKGNLIFYESDLIECGLEPTTASVYSGVFTQVFREESGLYQDKVYCFIHLSVQEFLAALHVHLTFSNSGVNLLSTEQSFVSEEAFYQSTVDQALTSPNGHLDLFLRFLLGLSLPTNQSLLPALLIQTGSSSQSNQETVKYIHKRLNENLSAESSMNLFHCLNELNDRSLVKEIQMKMRDGGLSRNMSPSQWSGVAFLLLSSDTDLEEFDMNKYHAPGRALPQLLPIVKASTKAILRGCGLSQISCGHLSTILSSSSLTLLDLSNNGLQDSGVKLLCSGLNCRLETLSLSSCNLSQSCCGPLSSVLSSSSLTLLDLSNNNLQDSGVEQLCFGLMSTSCKLEILSLSCCNLSQISCGPLSSVLSSSSLTLLDLSNNDLQDSGVELLCSGLKSTPFRLEILRLSGCLVSVEGGASLVSVLSSAHSHLRELDLSYNHPGPTAERLTTLLEDPHCPLDTLRLEPAGDQWMTPGLRKYFCEFTLDLNTADGLLQLSDNNRTVTCFEEKQQYPHHQDRFMCWPQVLCSTGLTGRCYWEVEWSGNEVHIAMSYKGISRNAETEDGVFGKNDQSWSLRISDGEYYVYHKETETQISSHFSQCGRVGVYLDSEAGSLSFYGVSYDGEYFHLHTFSSTFTEPLFPGFGLWPGSSVSLVTLDT